MASSSNHDMHAQEQWLPARVADAVRQTARGGSVKWIGFLRETEQAQALDVLRGERFENYLLDGGYPEAERKLLGLFPEAVAPAADASPVTCYKVCYRKQDRLTHRDVLGALLNCGLQRETVGDIIVGEGKTFVFMASARFGPLLSDLSKVGRVGVAVRPLLSPPSFPPRPLLAQTASVASGRLDVIVAALTGQSRTAAALLIKSGKVLVDHREAVNVEEHLRAGDTLSIRGVGKFRLESLDGRTRKGRLILRWNKYV